MKSSQERSTTLVVHGWVTMQIILIKYGAYKLFFNASFAGTDIRRIVLSKAALRTISGGNIFMFDKFIIMSRVYYKRIIDVAFVYILIVGITTLVYQKNNLLFGILTEIILPLVFWYVLIRKRGEFSHMLQLRALLISVILAFYETSILLLIMLQVKHIPVGAPPFVLSLLLVIVVFLTRNDE